MPMVLFRVLESWCFEKKAYEDLEIITLPWLAIPTRSKRGWRL